MLQLVERLVNIDSGSHTKKGIDEIGSILKTKFESLDFIVNTVEQQNYGNQLVIQHREANQPHILIVAHMDTVFPEGTAQKRPFKVKGNRAYGPGVADMKSSLVELFYAIHCLKQTGQTGYKHIQIILNSDEEIGSPSSASLISEKAANKKFALILEPARTDGSLVTARRGCGQFKVDIMGVAAHSGIEPEKGRSAIEELAHKIIALHRLNDQKKGISVNVGKIEGGSAVNMIASHAAAFVDVRISEKKQESTVLKQLKKICAETYIPGTKTTLSGKMDRSPMEKNEKSNLLLETIRQAGKEIGIEITDTATGGGSDASITSELGIATVDGLGPIGGNAHSEEEYLEIPSLTERTLLLATVLQKLSKMT
ncbi:M20 family metallopeptidase [Peribacillus simplex]|uniref:M20 family metallopeptidase n=1 Tax=Peribacillus simplex TaxID=1478 RepID=A0A9X9ERT9_9BACI|nr:M20 family metallopeptidase [Peribacillus simplex]TKH01169.1 M20 family metallopeptidase [Peribacillus simplex]TKH09813.1 M20 family metallopeptidase [Peribacillus simplex]